MVDNKMAEVAQLFNKKLGEEFKLNGLVVKFGVNGLYAKYNSSYSNGWIINNNLLIDLLTGKAVIRDEQDG